MYAAISIHNRAHLTGFESKGGILRGRAGDSSRMKGRSAGKTVFKDDGRKQGMKFHPSVHLIRNRIAFQLLELYLQLDHSPRMASACSPSRTTPDPLPWHDWHNRSPSRRAWQTPRPASPGSAEPSGRVEPRRTGGGRWPRTWGW